VLILPAEFSTPSHSESLRGTNIAKKKPEFLLLSRGARVSIFGVHFQFSPPLPAGPNNADFA
jgi:hypothetical protein